MTTLGVFRDDFYNSVNVLAQSQVTATTQGTGTVLLAANMAGAGDTYVGFSGQTGALAITTDTAINIIAQMQTAVAQAQAAALKLAAGSGSTTSPGTPPAGVGNLFNLTYTLTVVNNNLTAGTITLTGGTGVTITGSAVITFSTTTVYVVTINSSNTVTMTRVGSGGV